MNGNSISNGNETNSGQNMHGGLMGVLMLLCCLLPIAAILAVTVFGLPFSGIVTFAILLACPLMMVFMMGGHGHGAPEAHSSDTEREPTKTDIGTW